MSSKFWHIFNVMLCVAGIAGGISGGATFQILFNNNAAALWAGVSVFVFTISLLQELFKQHDILHVFHTHFTLLCCQVISVLVALLLAVLTVLHFIVAYSGEEALENMEYNDYMVGIWTLYCLKSFLGLSYSSHKCRKRLLECEGLRQRPESPNFISGGGSVPYEQLNSPRRSARRTQPPSDDESVITESVSVTTGDQSFAVRAVTVISDGESTHDMDRAAEELDAGVPAFGGARLVVT